MSCDIATHAAQQESLDDEIIALSVQLNEINCHGEKGKGKHRADNPPDTELALSAFQTEVMAHIAFLNDIKLAHSISHAVGTDSQLIIEIAEGEAQAQQDRRFALQINDNDPEQENPPPYTQMDSNATALEERLRLLGVSDYDHLDDPNEGAGPSMTRAENHEQETETSSTMNSQCCACLDNFQRSDIRRLQCKHIYCNDCLKGLFMRSTKDQTLFPPRCCRQNIPLLLISAEMSADELDTFNEAVIEFSTSDRTYCSNIDCGRFVPPSQIKADKAQCGRCGFATCAMCKNAFHNDDCPADPCLQETLDLANSQGWQRCYACRALVELNFGCYHITCKCRAQFCYICGLKWKSCSCERWEEGNLVNRAEEVVDREAIYPLHRHERQHLVGLMQEELRENHECDHPGRFQRIFDGGRHGFACEMCEDRHWKYILQCRHCHVRVCEQCRRNRV